MRPPGSVRVMTWNIHGALGRNPGVDLDRVVWLIRHHGPDIVALQEVGSRRPREAAARDPFEALRDAVGGHGVDARTITRADGDYGQMLVSRWPVSNVVIRDLSEPGREPRRAIHADVATPMGPLRVVATHLGFSLRERRRQVFGLLGLLGDLRVATVAMGDLNDWLWAGSVASCRPAAGSARSPRPTRRSVSTAWSCRRLSPLPTAQERGGTS